MNTLRVILFGVFAGGFAHAACTGSSPTWTTTIDAASVKTCVSNSVKGDTINVSSGSASDWAAITIPNSKNITLACPSSNCTITTDNAVVVNTPSTGATRVTGFTFTNAGDSNNGDVLINPTGYNPSFRVDHNTFTNSSQSVFLLIAGNDNGNEGQGLIDHNTFVGGGASEEIHVLGSMNANCTTCWKDDVVPGSSSMIFVEDNTFQTNDTVYLCSGIQSYYGARTVIRHNTFMGCQVDQHGTSGLTWTRWWEIYDNTFNAFDLNTGSGQCCYVELRGGSGVVWGNTATNNKVSAADIGLQVETCGSGSYPVSGYPNEFQVGSGIITGTATLHSSPAYLWSNTFNSSAIPVNVESGTGCLKLNTDFFTPSSQPTTLTRCESAADITAGCPVSYSYTPYTYPHPLQSSSGPAPGTPGTPTATPR